MSDKKMWTQNDARAEMCRVLKDMTVSSIKGQIHYDLNRVREIGVESGFTKDSDDILDRMRAIMFGGTIWVDRTCKDCGFEYATRAGPPPICWMCTAKATAANSDRSRDGAPEWWDKIKEISRTLEGCMIIPFVIPFDQAIYRRDRHVSISNSPQVFVEPRYLIVDPMVGDGSLEALMVGHDSLIVSDGRVPLSMFNPRSWASPEAMLTACSLQTMRISPANRVTLCAELDEPGPFRAVIWCRAFNQDGKPL